MALTCSIRPGRRRAPRRGRTAARGSGAARRESGTPGPPGTGVDEYHGFNATFTAPLGTHRMTIYGTTTDGTSVPAMLWDGQITVS